MGQIDQFLAAFKSSLKAKNIIYRDLAKSLNLSESSVKRILTDKSISLERIDEICKACDISFSEVCRNANFEEDVSNHTLTKEQEKILAENPRQLHYFILLNDGLTPTKIEKEYEITNNESKKILLQLDKLNLLELHPRDRVKLKNKTGSLRFRKDGAVGKILFAQTKTSYLNHDFESDLDYIRFVTNSYPVESIAKFKKKLDKIVSELQEETRMVAVIDSKGIHDMGVLLAFRPWTNSSLDAIKKK
jgi:transcriptional regulator with XRE-family HTH domain